MFRDMCFDGHKRKWKTAMQSTTNKANQTLQSKPNTSNTYNAMDG